MVYPVQQTDSTSNRSYSNEAFAYCQTQSPSIFLAPQQQHHQQFIYSHYNSAPRTSSTPQYIGHARKPGALTIREQG